MTSQVFHENRQSRDTVYRTWNDFKRRGTPRRSHDLGAGRQRQERLRLHSRRVTRNLISNQYACIASELTMVRPFIGSMAESALMARLFGKSSEGSGRSEGRKRLLLGQIGAGSDTDSIAQYSHTRVGIGGIHSRLQSLRY